MHNLGQYYQYKKNNFELAIKYYEMAIENGNVHAIYALYKFYKDTKNYKQIKIYLKMINEKNINLEEMRDFTMIDCN